MLYGIGCDLCEIAHLEKSLTGAHAAAFIRRVYGEAERAALSLDEPLPAGRSAAHRLASAAANFAAKEAFLKAAGTGLREPFSLCEIEAVRWAVAFVLRLRLVLSVIWLPQKFWNRFTLLCGIRENPLTAWY